MCYQGYQNSSSECLCGCYYHLHSTDYYKSVQKHYLPLLESEAHSNILSTTSRTVLKQTFTNPSKPDTIQECIYTFPLYDGVSVVSFTCRVGERVLTGLVRGIYKAKRIFDDAIAKGETAGLLAQAPEASDVFSTTLGNIPAGESVCVEITYIGELKHHETDGIRFTIPTKVAPRYGDAPSLSSRTGLPPVDGSGIKITVDINMPETSSIKGVQSPSHPIAVSIGAISTATKADLSMNKASATLSLGSATLEKDFVLIVNAKDIGIPKAILETHPTIPNQRALMATLVPNFSLPPSRPEIVFVTDRSGSMENNITMLISAMTVFLKSLPVGVKFNICSFGSDHSFLWNNSQAYNADTLAQATRHVQTFSADMGGTHTFQAVEATIKCRYADIPLEIILLTDGDIWNQKALFDYVNQQVVLSSGNIRVFPLGIGDGVSHAFIEGLARAGNGFASAVQDGERLDKSVVRMLRGALSPHIANYTLEVKYEQQDDESEVIENVTEGLKVLLSDEEDGAGGDIAKKTTTSLFDSSVDSEKDDIKEAGSPYAHLPNVSVPSLLQAPHTIPSIFSFSRTSVYLLLSPETIQRNPIAVTLRATSTHGPLALEIPIESLSTPAETIHQLAARKAIQDLEEGRGWVNGAQDQHEKLIKDKYPSCYDEVVQREAVRLGEMFQVAGKWTSFVAVAANGEDIATSRQKVEGGIPRSVDESNQESQVPGNPFPGGRKKKRSHGLSAVNAFQNVGQQHPTASYVNRHEAKDSAVDRSFECGGGGIRERRSVLRSSTGALSAVVGGATSFFGASNRSGPRSSSSERFVLPATATMQSQPPPPPPSNAPMPCAKSAAPMAFRNSAMSDAPVKYSMVTSGQESRNHRMRAQTSIDPSPDLEEMEDGISQQSPIIDWSTKPPRRKMFALVSLQDFDGSWAASNMEISKILGVDTKRAGISDDDAWVTLLVVKYIEEKLPGEEGTWGLVVEKARGWLLMSGLIDLEEMEIEAQKCTLMCH